MVFTIGPGTIKECWRESKHFQVYTVLPDTAMVSSDGNIMKFADIGADKVPAAIRSVLPDIGPLLCMTYASDLKGCAGSLANG
jgi:hypothetical protein